MFILVNDSIDIGDLVHIALLFCIVEFLRPTADARLFDVKLAEMIVKKKIHYVQNCTRFMSYGQVYWKCLCLNACIFFQSFDEISLNFNV